LGYSLGEPEASIVTVSHAHPGHSYLQGVRGSFKDVKGPGEYEIQGIFIIGIATFHDDEKGAQRGKNTVYLMEVDGITVCHLGDLGHVLTAEQQEGIESVDILLVPVGGVNTMDASAAAEVVRQLEPKVVIPMHYQTAALKRRLDPVDRFLKEMGIKEVESKPKLSFTKATLPMGTQVLLLDY